MDFRFNVNKIFKDPIVEINASLIPPGVNLADKRALWDAVGKVADIVNIMGEASAAAQGLTKPITSSERLRNSDHRLYLLIDQSANNSNGAVVGMLKTGKKGLYVFDRDGHHYQVQPSCVLDFYVHESKQRKGLGKKLYEYMLENEKVEPVKMAVDRPSDKFLGFLNKHYNLENPVKQMNNFVVYDGFFPEPVKKDEVNITPRVKSNSSANGLQANYGSPYGRYGAPRPASSMKQIMHNQSPLAQQTQEQTGLRIRMPTKTRSVYSEKQQMNSSGNMNNQNQQVPGTNENISNTPSNVYDQATTPISDTRSYPAPDYIQNPSNYQNTQVNKQYPMTAQQQNVQGQGMSVENLQSIQNANPAQSGQTIHSHPQANNNQNLHAQNLMNQQNQQIPGTNENVWNTPSNAYYQATTPNSDTRSYHASNNVQNPSNYQNIQASEQYHMTPQQQNIQEQRMSVENLQPIQKATHAQSGQNNIQNHHAQNFMNQQNQQVSGTNENIWNTPSNAYYQATTPISDTRSYHASNNVQNPSNYQNIQASEQYPMAQQQHNIQGQGMSAENLQSIQNTTPVQSSQTIHSHPQGNNIQNLMNQQVPGTNENIWNTPSNAYYQATTPITDTRSYHAPNNVQNASNYQNTQASEQYPMPPQQQNIQGQRISVENLQPIQNTTPAQSGQTIHTHPQGNNIQNLMNPGTNENLWNAPSNIYYQATTPIRGTRSYHAPNIVQNSSNYQNIQASEQYPMAPQQQNIQGQRMSVENLHPIQNTTPVQSEQTIHTHPQGNNKENLHAHNVMNQQNQQVTGTNENILNTPSNAYYQATTPITRSYHALNNVDNPANYQNTQASKQYHITPQQQNIQGQRMSVENLQPIQNATNAQSGQNNIQNLHAQNLMHQQNQQVAGTNENIWNTPSNAYYHATTPVSDTRSYHSPNNVQNPSNYQNTQVNKQYPMTPRQQNIQGQGMSAAKNTQQNVPQQNTRPLQSYHQAQQQLDPSTIIPPVEQINNQGNQNYRYYDSNVGRMQSSVNEKQMPGYGGTMPPNASGDMQPVVQ